MKIDIYKKNFLIKYGKTYAIICGKWLDSNENDSQKNALQMGMYAFNYFVQAEAFEEINELADTLVVESNNILHLNIIISELEIIIKKVPSGEIRWCMRTCLAHAFNRSGQIKQSLALYKKAANEAKNAKNWQDVCWIYQGWANALFDVGQLIQARHIYENTICIQKQEKHPQIHIILAELEIFRIDIIQGKVKKILPIIENRLTICRLTWKKWQYNTFTNIEKNEYYGATIDEVKHTLISGLDVFLEAHTVLKNWEICLDTFDEMKEIEKSSGSDEYTLAKIDIDRSGILVDLKQLDRAKQNLEKCLSTYKKIDDIKTQSNILSILAEIWEQKGDLPQAISLERQALFLSEKFDNPDFCAISHHNLSNYLHKIGYITEDAQHRLAGITYDIVTDNKISLRDSLNNVIVDLNEAKKIKRTYALPHLKDLLKNKDFKTLLIFLQEQEVDVDQLQKEINTLVKNTYNKLITKCKKK